MECKLCGREVRFVTKEGKIYVECDCGLEGLDTEVGMENSQMRTIETCKLKNFVEGLDQ